LVVKHFRRCSPPECLAGPVVECIGNSLNVSALIASEVGAPREVLTLRGHLAIDIYRRAEESGDEITLRTMERRLSELLSHEPGCTK